MANAVNEALIRDVIQDVLGRLGGDAPAAPAGEDKGSCGCSGKSGGKDFGVFQCSFVCFIELFPTYFCVTSSVGFTLADILTIRTECILAAFVCS